MDPWRWRRIGRAIQRLALPTAPRGWPFALWLGAVGYLAFVAASAVGLWWLGDRWWAATGLLFGPRWLVMLPLPPLLVASWITDRGLVPLLAVSGAITLGPVMGLRLGWRAWLPDSADGPILRIASFNVQGDAVGARVRALLLEWEVDVLASQECGASVEDALLAAIGWHVDLHEGLCLASRFPIAGVWRMEREVFAEVGGAALVATYGLDLGPDTVYLTNVHFDTPRDGLEPLRGGDFAEGIPRLAEKTTLRGIEHRRAREWLEGFPPGRLVAGDFNAPVESVIYQESWGDWTNAFSAAGWGFGRTRMSRWIRARIDHILSDDRWVVHRSWVGPDVGSDHRPLFAELRLRPRT